MAENSGETVHLERRDEIAVIWLNNPERLNAFSAAMWQGLGDRLENLRGDTSLRCLIIRGAPSKDGRVAFGAGADMSEFPRLRHDAASARHYAKAVDRANLALKESPFPSIAAIQGACVGGGLEVALHCDLRLAETGARFGIPINRIGHALPYGAMIALVGLAGRAVAMELLLEGRLYEAEEALAKGLITRLVTPESFEEEIEKTARRIAAGAPLAASAHKRFSWAALTPEGLDEAAWNAPYDLCDSEDYREGLAAFLEKRKPNFKGR